VSEVIPRPEELTETTAFYEDVLDIIGAGEPAEIVPALQKFIMGTMEVDEVTASFIAAELTADLPECAPQPVSPAKKMYAETRIIKPAYPTDRALTMLALKTMAYVATAPDTVLSPAEIYAMSKITVRFATDRLWPEGESYLVDDEDAAVAYTDEAKAQAVRLFIEQVRRNAQLWLARIADAPGPDEFDASTHILTMYESLNQQFASPAAS
jgi:hypothetical protein